LSRNSTISVENAKPFWRARLHLSKQSKEAIEDPMAHWLMKSEPDAYSIDDMQRDGRDMWDGIRNYQARNMMRDDMKIGDEIFFYHSNCKQPGVVGITRVVSEPYPDPTQFDKKSNYFDAKSPTDNPRWILVDVEFVQKLSRNITLTEIKAQKSLEDMILTRRGNRLSVMPVQKKHWNKILSLE
jgi:predicted RNA-binding protein with PUA-like domain